LVYAEIGNALLVEQRAGLLPASELASALNEIMRLPLAVVPIRALIGDALAIASARALSAYDACYVALAEANDAVLVTADRKLAAATTRSALIV
jgi:predicted nucleic acid-binding protein